MDLGDTSPITRFLIAAVLGAVLGVVVHALIKPVVSEETPVAESAEAPLSPEMPGVEPAGATSPGWRYAVAVQEGNWDQVIDMTLWMQERLQRVLVRTDDPGALAEARDALQTQLGERSIAGNQLREEGVEDPYVFTPGALLERLGKDGGDEDLDLERPVAERVYIRVTYPVRTKALLDETGLPIRALTVGVNVAGDGMVLKANVVGNLEIFRDTISYAWPEPEAMVSPA